MATGFICLDAPPATVQGVYPRRGIRGKLTGTVILHTSEGLWTAGVDSLIGLVLRRADFGCYHRAVDWVDIAKFYPWEWETWQDSETNNWAVGIAAACRTVDWRTMPAEIRTGYLRNMARCAADFVRYMKTTYGITVPLVRITGAQARAGVPGFCAHGDSGIARSDPGADFDWATFFRYTREELAAGTSTGTAGQLVGATEVNQVVDALKKHFNAVLLGPYTWANAQGVVETHEGGVIRDIVEQVWQEKVRRSAGEVNVKQELADAKTQAIANAKTMIELNIKLDELLARTAPPAEPPSA